MLTIKRVGWSGFVAGLALASASALVAAPAAKAFTTVDGSAGLLVLPKIVVDLDGVCVGGAFDGEVCPGGGCTGGYCLREDTVVQIANLDSTLSAAHCFYVNANSHCTNTGDVCTSSDDCIGDTFTGACVPDWAELNFDIRITREQPFVWRASSGLSGGELPCTGRFDSPCSGNQGTRIPPVPETPFLGELKCIQVDPNDPQRRPGQCDPGACSNDLIGQATIEKISSGISETVDPRSYHAIGLIAFSNNDDNGVLTIGGPAPAEYLACPRVLVVNFLFDGAIDPISDEATASTELTLVPCSEDLLSQRLTPITAQFLIYNEFEQRFSTSRQVNCLFNSPLSLIDTTQAQRSVFNAGTAGTVAGQARITGVNGGLLGVAELEFVDISTGTLRSGAAYNLNQFGERVLAGEQDIIRIP